MSSWICRIPVQLETITDKNIAAGLSNVVFAFLIGVTWTKKAKFIATLQI